MYKIDHKKLAALVRKRNLDSNLVSSRIYNMMRNDSVVTLKTLRKLSAFLKAPVPELLAEEPFVKVTDTKRLVRLSAEKVQRMCRQKGLTPDELRTKAGYSHGAQFLAKFAGGKDFNVSRYYFDKMCEVLGCKAEELLGTRDEGRRTSSCQSPVPSPQSLPQDEEEKTRDELKKIFQDDTFEDDLFEVNEYLKKKFPSRSEPKVKVIEDEEEKNSELLSKLISELESVLKTYKAIRS